MSQEKNIFNPSSIATAMITHYPKWYRRNMQSIKNTDKIRGDLAIETIIKARQQGYPVLVADGQSSKTFRKTLSQMPELNLIKRESMKRRLARKQVIKMAQKLNEVKVIVETEAEKVSLITKCIPMITDLILNNKADIVVPKRNLELFKKTYPNYQYESEIEGNILYNEILKTSGFRDQKDEDLDLFFGPVAMKNTKMVVELFLGNFGFKVDLNAKSRQFFQQDEYGFLPIVAALKNKLRVKSVEVPFEYPKTQKMNELAAVGELFREKRRNQRMSILIDLLYFVQYLK